MSCFSNGEFVVQTLYSLQTHIDYTGLVSLTRYCWEQLNKLSVYWNPLASAAKRHFRLWDLTTFFCCIPCFFFPLEFVRFRFMARWKAKPDPGLCSQSRLVSDYDFRSDCGSDFSADCSSLESATIHRSALILWIFAICMLNFGV